jgi:hypothetical protein
LPETRAAEDKIAAAILTLASALRDENGSTASSKGPVARLTSRSDNLIVSSLFALRSSSDTETQSHNPNPCKLLQMNTHKASSPPVIASLS